MSEEEVTSGKASGHLMEALHSLKHGCHDAAYKHLLVAQGHMLKLPKVQHLLRNLLHPPRVPTADEVEQGQTEVTGNEA